MNDETNPHDHPDLGLPTCMSVPEHGPSHAAVGIGNSNTGEKRVVFMCIHCFQAREATEMMSVLVGPGPIGMLNSVLMQIGMTNAAAITHIEVALERDDVDSKVREHLTEILAIMRREELREEDKDVTPIDANAFAQLMARTNTTNPEREN